MFLYLHRESETKLPLNMLEHKDFDPRKIIFNLNKFNLKRKDDLKDLTRKIKKKKKKKTALKFFSVLFLWRRTPEKTDPL